MLEKETSEKNEKKLQVFDLNGRIERLEITRRRSKSYSFFLKKKKKTRIRDFFWILMRVENMQAFCCNSTRKKKHIFLAVLNAVYNCI